MIGQDDLAKLAVTMVAAPLAVRNAVGALLRDEGARVAADARTSVARLTGATAAGIQVTRAHRTFVEIDATDEASQYLEYGTSDTAPQPFMRPAGDRAELRIGGNMDRVIGGVIEGMFR